MRDLGQGRTAIAESIWDWMLIREPDGSLLLSVVCGSVGIYEVDVVLDTEQTAAFAANGAPVLQRLAEAVRKDPAHYLAVRRQAP